jgi:hypothetical protein
MSQSLVSASLRRELLTIGANQKKSMMMEFIGVHPREQLVRLC